MKTSAVILKVYSCKGQEGQAVIKAVRDTDIHYGDISPSRTFTVIFKNQSSLSYPPLPGERIRFEHETDCTSLFWATEICGRSAPGEQTDIGIEGSISGIKYLPPEEYFFKYIAAYAGVKEWPEEKLVISSAGREVSNAILNLIALKKENSIFFIDGIAMDMSLLLEPYIKRELIKKEVKISFNSMYHINPLLRNRPFTVTSSGKEIQLAKLYRDIYISLVSKPGVLTKELNEILSDLTDMGFSLRTARKICVNSALFSGMRYSEKFLFSLGICRENTSRIIRSFGPLATEQVTVDPYQIALAGLISAGNMSQSSENFTKITPEIYIKTMAGEILEEEYLKGNRTLSIEEMQRHIAVKTDILRIPGTRNLDVKSILLDTNGESPFSVTKLGNTTLFEHKKVELSEDYLTTKLISLAFPDSETEVKEVKTTSFPDCFLHRNDLSRGNRLLEIFAEKYGEHGVGDYAISQREALGNLFFSCGLDILTGEPGSGKTTLIKVLAILFALFGENINVLSPTGKAVKRIEELLSDAIVPEEIKKKIHMMTVHKYVYSHTCIKSTVPGIYIVDEASMLDTEIFTRLMSTIPEGSKLILSGDIEQLGSTGTGSPFKEAINSEVFKHTYLKGSYRHSNPAITALAETMRSYDHSFTLEEICKKSGVERIYIR